MSLSQQQNTVSTDGLGRWTRQLPNPAIDELIGAAGTHVRFAARSRLFGESERRDRLYVLVSGWTYAYRTFPDGRHHVAEIYVPGELIGLSEAWLGAPGCGVLSLTAGLAAPIGRTALLRHAQASPALAQGLVSLIAQDNFSLSQRLSSLARHTAYERLATLLWWLRERLPDGLHGPNGFHCPLPQHIIGDALGLSAVHVNRSLRQLARDGVLEKQSASVDVLDNTAFQRIVHG